MQNSRKHLMSLTRMVAEQYPPRSCLMRAMGQNPTEVERDGNGTIEFLDMMKKKASEVDEEAELR